ncbi:hypothetical protein SAMN05428970_3296 [Agromyces sp. CF514]|uniref:hypothetical protein n=1 Tax=Agromyces sp. CF514 TaxID=1881031 RepID=UPI0008E712BF|nr:hypothetical protein [Agromyces sp. CF514]SFR86371.1 hypothetical protein SAMN05428970_3296 [Agromyces sp. CF514]
MKAVSTRRRSAITLITEVVAWGALVVFTVLSLGSSLIGTSTFLRTDMFANWAPWTSTLEDSPLQLPFWGDTVDSGASQTMLLTESAHDGVLAEWNPYVAGGAELGGLPNSGAYSPLSAPWWILPSEFAPAAVKVLEIAVIAVGMSLLLRRLGAKRVTWPLAALAYASSGFMIAWTNWPQTRVAALVPLLFWALDRAAVRRRARDAVPVAAALAGMLLGGFPAVVAYALYAGGAYVLVRAAATSGRVKAVLRASIVALAGVVGGVLLSAWQIVPFAINAANVIDFGVREQTGDSHSAFWNLASAFVPDINGGPDGVGIWRQGHPIEAFSYAGIAVVGLAACAVVIRARRRSRVSAVGFFATALAICVVLTYVGGFALELAQELPIMSTNSIGRLRSIIGFFVAVLAALGMSKLLDPVPLKVEWRLARASRTHLIGLVLRIVFAIALAVGTVVIVREAYDQVPLDDRFAMLRHQARWIAAGALVVIALVIGAYLWTRRAQPVRVLVTVAALAVVTTVPAVGVTDLWWKTSRLDTFFVVTDTHEFLADELGGSRYATVNNAMMPGSSSAYRLRAVDGHAFHTTQWRDLLLAVDPDMMPTPTYSSMNGDNLPESITSPVLDRLAVEYVVAPPGLPVIGSTETPGPATGTVALASGESASTAVGTGPLRGLVLTAPEQLGGANGIRLNVDLLAADGSTITSTSTWMPHAQNEVRIAVMGDDLDASTQWTARVTVEGDDLRGAFATADDGTLTAAIVRPEADGLRIAHTGDSTVYERTTALDRVRWASDSIVEEDSDRQVEMLASGEIGDDTVLLDDAADEQPTEPGSSATVVETDGDDRMQLQVDADGPGWVVVADSLDRPGWSATLDGEPVELAGAEHAAAAVHVDEAGQHEIVLEYRTPGLTAGIAVTALTLLGLLAWGIVGFVVRRRRS